MFSLLIFTGIYNTFLSPIIKVLSAFTIAAIAFGIKDKIGILKNTAAVFGITILFSGLMMLFIQLFRPPNLYLLDNFVYFEFNPIVMIAVTVLIYGIVLLFYRLFRERIKTTVVSLSFMVGEQSYHCIGKIDTGCNLREPFSDAPVIITDAHIFSPDEKTPKRVIPYRTINGESILTAVKADAVLIDHKPINTEVYIASGCTGSRNFDAIINSEIIR